ncbi:MAG: hypothetical protein ACOCY0_01910 [Roseicyclus sp.]
MLATGGLLGLLLMGAAVGGLVTGMDSDEDADDDTARRDGPARGGLDAAARDADRPMALDTWLETFGDAEETASAQDRAPAGLSTLLFGRAAASDAEEPPFTVLQDVRDADLAEEAEAPDAAPMQADPVRMAMAAPAHLDVFETVAFGNGPEIPLVTDFDAETDRLILDFPGDAADAPEIGVDLALSPGDALVLADGVPVTFVAGAATLSPAQIDIVMTGAAAAAPAMGSYESLGMIRNFDPAAQQIEIDYDPAILAEPQVAIQDFEDGSGADILLNGEVIVSVAGAQGLDPSLVVLRPV